LCPLKKLALALRWERAFCVLETHKMQQEPVLLSEPKAARVIGFDRGWLYRRRLDGTGPRHIKIGRSIRYRRADLEAFIKAHERGGPQAT
jgi:predicted DNA-binding transcriptional regulator AlpA